VFAKIFFSTWLTLSLFFRDTGHFLSFSLLSLFPLKIKERSRKEKEKRGGKKVQSSGV
jgi:hypothetical protein